MDYKQKKVVIRLLKRIVKQIHQNRRWFDSSNYVFMDSLESILLERNLLFPKLIIDWEDRRFLSPRAFIVPELTIHGIFTPNNGGLDNAIIAVEREFIGNDDEKVSLLTDLHQNGADSLIIRKLRCRDEVCLLDESILAIVFSFAVLALYVTDLNCSVKRFSKVNGVEVIEGTVLFKEYDVSGIISDSDWYFHHFRVVDGKVKISSSYGAANSVSRQRDEVISNRESSFNIVER